MALGGAAFVLMGLRQTGSLPWQWSRLHELETNPR